jgi:hypothetical protein
MALFSLIASIYAGCDDSPGLERNWVERRSGPPEVSVSGTAPSGDTTPADTRTPDATPPDTQSADTQSADTTPPDTVSPEIVDPGPTAPVDINTTFIGGACQNDAQCDYTNGNCLTPAEGFPNGMCSQPCTQFCPDEDGMVQTFCVDGESVDLTGGACVSKCSFERSETGCRAGYTCVDETRLNDSRKTSWVCLPGVADGCIQRLVDLGVEFSLPLSTSMSNPDGYPNEVCDVYEPVSVSGTLNGVRFRPSSFTAAPSEMYVQCGVALALWEMAELAKTRGITDFVHYGTYNCRFISGTTNLSEHAFANAIDIAGVKTSTGETYTLLDDWEDGDTSPETPGGQLLYWLAQAMHAQKIWNIILTPEYNAAHDNHFHVDLTPGADFLSE